LRERERERGGVFRIKTLSIAKITLYCLGFRWVWSTGEIILTGEDKNEEDKRALSANSCTTDPKWTGPEWNSDLHAERPQLVGLLFRVTEAAFPTAHINIIVINIR
jgi:hypothetical protein